MREPYEAIEIDIDYCSRVYGVGACNAVLGATGERKCFNMYRHCQVPDVFNKVVKTIRYTTPTSFVDVNQISFPFLVSISDTTGKVNIAGANPKLNSLGSREVIKARFQDARESDRYFDKYRSGRIDGTAQTDEAGYDPAGRGTHFGKLKSRFPFYPGRPMRRLTGYVENGELTITKTRHYVISAFDGPDDSGSVEFSAKDILSLVDDKKAVAPAVSDGVLVADITIDSGIDATISPAGYGDLYYPASGYVSIGSEIVKFTRVGDVLTLTERGAFNTTASTHTLGDSIQVALVYNNMRVDLVVADLLINYGKIDPSFIDSLAWATEVLQWASDFKVTTVITKPTGVSSLIGEIAQLGVNIWWDNIDQKIGFKLNRVPAFDTVLEYTDDTNIKAISSKDDDESRLTDVYINYDIINPTGSLTSGTNFAKVSGFIDQNARSANEFGDSKIKYLYSRWLADGNAATVRLMALRLLKLFRWAPYEYKFVVSSKQDVRLTDVIRLRSRIAQDETGNIKTVLMQATQIKEINSGFEYEITAQQYLFDGKYGLIADNARPSYTASTDTERAKGSYFCDDITLKLSDGSDPYVFS